MLLSGLSGTGRYYGELIKFSIASPADDAGAWKIHITCDSWTADDALAGVSAVNREIGFRGAYFRTTEKHGVCVFLTNNKFRDDKSYLDIMFSCCEAAAYAAAKRRAK
jgi:hypothetical protein